MSLSTLGTIAVQRDKQAPRRSKRRPATAGEMNDTEQRGYANVLVAAIPTEPLALYTALVGTIVAGIEAGEDSMLDMRWAIYAAGIVFIVAWLGSVYLRRPAVERKRRFPLVETASATVAFAAWGLVMPGSPLSAEISGDDLTAWTAIITVAGVAILGLLGVPLKQKTAKG